MMSTVKAKGYDVEQVIEVFLDGQSGFWGAV